MSMNQSLQRLQPPPSADGRPRHSRRPQPAVHPAGAQVQLLLLPGRQQPLLPLKARLCAALQAGAYCEGTRHRAPIQHHVPVPLKALAHTTATPHNPHGPVSSNEHDIAQSTYNLYT
jgi:hypothetical protein